jgi:hypothetical protein
VAGPEMRGRRSLAMKIELGGSNFTPRFAPGPVHCSAGLGAIVTNYSHSHSKTHANRNTRLAPRPGATTSTAAGRPLKLGPPRSTSGEPMKTIVTQSTFEGALKTALWNYKPKPQNPQGGTHFNPAPRMLPKPRPTNQAQPRGPDAPATSDGD